MLTLNDFISDYNHLVVRYYDDKGSLNTNTDILIQIYYLHIIDECMEYRRKCQINVK